MKFRGNLREFFFTHGHSCSRHLIWARDAIPVCNCTVPASTRTRCWTVRGIEYRRSTGLLVFVQSDDTPSCRSLQLQPQHSRIDTCRCRTGMRSWGNHRWHVEGIPSHFGMNWTLKRGTNRLKRRKNREWISHTEMYKITVYGIIHFGFSKRAKFLYRNCRS